MSCFIVVSAVFLIFLTDCLIPLHQQHSIYALKDLDF
uniref:Uncharacterized protein n=1 Tax=Heterorhabditis bacteriophora TaxID=37862 RepID=A0A1I7XBA8_HETBA